MATRIVARCCVPFLPLVIAFSLVPVFFVVVRRMFKGRVQATAGAAPPEPTSGAVPPVAKEGGHA